METDAVGEVVMRREKDLKKKIAGKELCAFSFFLFVCLLTWIYVSVGERGEREKTK